MVLMPGDPIDTLVSSIPNITPEDILRLKRLYGLDQPAYIRFFNWFSQLLSGDLGYSRTYKLPVTEIISSPIINTFVLSLSSIIIALIIAVPLGMAAAYRPHSLLDYIVNFIAFAGISIPSFWLGIILIIIFGVYIPILPAGGTFTINENEFSFFWLIIDRIKYLILPTLSLTFFQIGGLLRFTRTSMLENLKEDYIRTAHSKGLSLNNVLFKHALRNSIIPLITIITTRFGYIFSGAIITETVFAYNGLGKLIYNSVISNDFNVAMIGLILTIGMVLFMSFISDLLYTIADPRIKYEK
jgi:peptide/nickel transport system permease protein